jgi:hypothetical protein
MKLTTQIRKTESGGFRASFAEMPSIFYVAPTEKAALDRLMKLAHALESPNIVVDRILPDGDVVLVLSRGEDGGEGDTEEYWEPLPTDYSSQRMTA